MLFHSPGPNASSRFCQSITTTLLLSNSPTVSWDPLRDKLEASNLASIKKLAESSEALVRLGQLSVLDI